MLPREVAAVLKASPDEVPARVSALVEERKRLGVMGTWEEPYLTMNPAFEESAMFENMVDLMLGGEYDVYVFDTAPTANARRLLGMSQVYSLWVNKMVKSRDEARSLRELRQADHAEVEQVVGR